MPIYEYWTGIHPEASSAVTPPTRTRSWYVHKWRTSYQTLQEYEKKSRFKSCQLLTQLILYFVDVGVRRRDEGLGHEIVVVAHEELDGIVGEQRTQLVRKLRSQHLVDARVVAVAVKCTQLSKYSNSEVTEFAWINERMNEGHSTNLRHRPTAEPVIGMQ